MVLGTFRDPETNLVRPNTRSLFPILVFVNEMINVTDGLPPVMTNVTTLFVSRLTTLTPPVPTLPSSCRQPTVVLALAVKLLPAVAVRPFREVVAFSLLYSSMVTLPRARQLVTMRKGPRFTTLLLWPRVLSFAITIIVGNPAFPRGRANALVRPTLLRLPSITILLSSQGKGGRGLRGCPGWSVLFPLKPNGTGTFRANALSTARPSLNPFPQEVRTTGTRTANTELPKEAARAPTLPVFRLGSLNAAIQAFRFARSTRNITASELAGTESPLR